MDEDDDKKAATSKSGSASTNNSGTEGSNARGDLLNSKIQKARRAHANSTGGVVNTSVGQDERGKLRYKPNRSNQPGAVAFPAAAGDGDGRVHRGATTGERTRESNLISNNQEKGKFRYKPNRSNQPGAVAIPAGGDDGKLRRAHTVATTGQQPRESNNEDKGKLRYKTDRSSSQPGAVAIPGGGGGDGDGHNTNPSTKLGKGAKTNTQTRGLRNKNKLNASTSTPTTPQVGAVALSTAAHTKTTTKAGLHNHNNKEVVSQIRRLSAVDNAGPSASNLITNNNDGSTTKSRNKRASANDVLLPTPGSDISRPTRRGRSNSPINHQGLRGKSPVNNTNNNNNNARSRSNSPRVPMHAPAAAAGTTTRNAGAMRLGKSKQGRSSLSSEPATHPGAVSVASSSSDHNYSTIPQIPTLRGLAKNQQAALQAMGNGRQMRNNNISNQPPPPTSTLSSSPPPPPPTTTTTRLGSRAQSGLVDAKPSYLPYLSSNDVGRGDSQQTATMMDPRISSENEIVADQLPPETFDDEEVVALPSSTTTAATPPHHEEPPVPPSSSSPVMRRGDSDLAVAQPVEEEVDPSSLVAAEQIGLEEIELQRIRKMKRQQCRMWGYLIIGTCCFVIFLAVGFFLTKDDAKVVVSSPSVAPTSAAPSDIPSFAPTGALNLLVQDLPESTIEKIFDVYDSPQQKAYNWLLNHKNISNLEEWRKRQLFALATFHYSLEGGMWREDIKKDWLDQDKPECYWYSAEYGFFENGTFNLPESDSNFFSYGLEPCNDAGEYQSIVLADLHLSAGKPSIPPEIALLTRLSILSLPLNDINSTLSEFIPTEMPNLSALHMHSNPLSGTIPTWFADLTSLSSLQIWNSSLTGPIPSEIAMMSNLMELDLALNLLTGLPSEIGMMTNLRDLYLLQNYIKGTLPSQLGTMKNLTFIDLSENPINGTIPSEIGLLTSLTELRLAYNELSGAIPTSIGGLTNLLSLILPLNFLAGPIPSEVGLMTSLRDLELFFNHFSATIPSEVALVTTMRNIAAHHSALTGNIPTDLGAMTRLSTLWFHGNGLAGHIPSSLGLLMELKDLYLFQNSLTGSIPSELGLISNMEVLALDSNSLRGSIPTEVGQIGSMVLLQLQNNSLSGSIPTSVATMTNLNTLKVENNSLTGSVSSDLGLLVINGSLGAFTLENNDLTGVISQDLCLLGMYNSTLRAGLSFDCINGQLCGCCWCPCPGAETSKDC